MLKFDIMPLRSSGNDECALVRCDTNMVSVTLPDRYHFVPVTRITQKAFAKLPSLLEVVIPTSIRVIEEHAFAHCKNLRRVRFAGPASPKLGLGAFQGCVSLVQVELPDGIEEVGDAFYDCVALQEINLPDSVRHIDLGGCTALRRVSLPASLELADHDIFARCRDDMRITSPDGLGEKLLTSLAMWDIQQLGKQLTGFAALIRHEAFTKQQLQEFLPETCRRVVAKLLPPGREVRAVDGPYTTLVDVGRVRSRENLLPEEEPCVRFLQAAWNSSCEFPEEIKDGILRVAGLASASFVLPENGEPQVQVEYRTAFGLKLDEK